MKTLTSAFGLGLVLAYGLVAPMGAQAKPLFSSSPQSQDTVPNSSTVLPNSSTSLPNSSTPLPDNSVALPKKMAAYKDCVSLHTNVNGADFKEVNKFCACVADQSIQGSSGNLSDCATASKEGGGGAMSVIGEVAPSVISGVMQGLSSRSSRGGGLFGGGGGGLLGGLGDLLGGGSSNDDSNGGNFSIRDLLRNRL